MANPTLLSVPLCRDAEKNVIPVTDNGTTGKFSEQYGWQGINSLPLSAGGKAVERLDFNGVLALLGGIDYMTQRGYTFKYDKSLPYVVGCIIVDPLDGKTYRCINDVPAGASNPSRDATNWVSHDIADYVGGALRSTAYKVGDTSTLVGIPAGYFLECTKAGTTRAIAPVITTVTEGQTISDGTAAWTVRKCFPTSGGALTTGVICRNANTGDLSLMGGTNVANGGRVVVFGKNNADFPGYTILNANNGIESAQLQVSPNSTLELIKNAGTPSAAHYDLGGSAIVSQSLGNAGYVKYKDGFIMEWARISTGPGPNTFHVTFPIEIPTLPFGIFFINGSYTNDYNTGYSIKDVTSKGFSVYVGTNFENFVRWVAIGY